MGDHSDDMKQEVMDFLGDEIPEGFEEDANDFVEEDFYAEPEEEPPADEELPADPSADEEPPASDDNLEEPPAEPPVEPPAVEEPSTEDPAITALKEQNATLLAQFEELQGKIATMQQSPAEEPPAAQPVAQVGADGIIDFVGEADLDEILSDKAQFNQFLSNLVTQVQTSTTENIYRNLPGMVQNHVSSQQQITAQVEEFYKENEDLVTVKKTVGAVANEVAAEHPEYELAQVFSETATRVRTLLGLEKQAKTPTKPTNPSDTKPALPTSGARRTGVTTPKITGQERHILDVL